MSTTTTVHRYAGVDVSPKAHLDVAVRPTGERYSVVNDPEGIDTLVGRLVEADPALVVLEATGGFERSAAMALAASGIAVAVVNPRQARDVRAKATGRLAKTDKIDAYVLGSRCRGFGRPLGRRYVAVRALLRDQDGARSTGTEAVRPHRPLFRHKEASVRCVGRLG
jgi:transposase